MNRICTKCKIEKSIDDFYKRPKVKSGLCSHCKQCCNTNSKYKYNEQWVDRRSKIDEYHYKSINFRRSQIDIFKAQNGCCYCGYNEHPIALDFHHLIGEDKDRTISNAINRKWNIERLILEIQKCSILCAICHRLLHNGIITIEDIKPVRIDSLHDLLNKPIQ